MFGVDYYGYIVWLKVVVVVFGDDLVIVEVFIG